MIVHEWRLSGELVESCNCDYLCPCIYINSKGEVDAEADKAQRRHARIRFTLRPLTRPA